MNGIIYDTGYISNSIAIASQTQLGVTDRAGYTGSTVSAMTLKIQNMSIRGNTNTESKPILNTYSNVETSLISTSNDIISVNMILHKTLVTSGWDVNNLYQIYRLDKTRGLKLLYIDTPASDGMKTLIEGIGAVNTNNSIFSTAAIVGSTIPHLIGRVKNVTINDSESGDYWRIDFQFEVCGP